MNYSELVARLQAYHEDPDADFSAVVDDIIGLAELRISKDLDCDAMINFKADGTMTSGDHKLTKPVGCVAVNHFNYTISGTKRVILEFRRETSFLVDYHPDRAVTDPPRYYSNWGADEWYLAPTPDSNYPYEVEYGARISGLSSVVTTTWITLNYEDLLFFACLVEGDIFHKAPENVVLYEKKYAYELSTAKAEVERIRSDRTSIHR